LICNLHRGNRELHCAITKATSNFYVPVIMRHSPPAFRYMSCPRRMLYKGWRHRSNHDSSTNRIHRPTRREQGTDLQGQQACERLLGAQAAGTGSRNITSNLSRGVQSAFENNRQPTSIWRTIDHTRGDGPGTPQY
jgi:hypothetical protein